MKFSSSKCEVTRFGAIRSSAMAGDMTWQEEEADIATDPRKTMSLYCNREEIVNGEE